MTVPARAPSPSISRPASSRAIRAAATANWLARSMRPGRAGRCRARPRRSPRTSQAILQWCCEASKRVIEPRGGGPGQGGVPGRAPADAERRDDAEAGDDDAVRVPHMRSPPSTASTVPVMKAAPSEQRNATGPATSSGVPRRPRAVAREQVVAVPLGQHVGEARGDVAGGDGVDAHSARAGLAGQRAGEADDPGLGARRSSPGRRCPGPRRPTTSSRCCRHGGAACRAARRGRSPSCRSG